MNLFYEPVRTFYGRRVLQESLIYLSATETYKCPLECKHNKLRTISLSLSLLPQLLQFPALTEINDRLRISNKPNWLDHYAGGSHGTSGFTQSSPQT